MLVHLKKCVRFSSKNPSNNIRIPKNMAHLCSSMETLPAMETSTEQEELEVVTLALQAYGWQRSTGGGGDKSKPFQKFPCSLCNQLGHNIMQCKLRPFLLDMLPELKNRLTQSKTQGVKPLN
jgi:hypothetical protein